MSENEMQYSSDKIVVSAVSDFMKIMKTFAMWDFNENTEI